jgi:hypothetical protein
VAHGASVCHKYLRFLADTSRRGVGRHAPTRIKRRASLAKRNTRVFAVIDRQTDINRVISLPFSLDDDDDDDYSLLN